MVDPINPIHRHHVLQVPLAPGHIGFGTHFKRHLHRLRDSPQQPSGHQFQPWRSVLENHESFDDLHDLPFEDLLFIYIVDFLINMFGYRRLRS